MLTTESQSGAGLEAGLHVCYAVQASLILDASPPFPPKPPHDHATNMQKSGTKLAGHFEVD